MSNTISGAQPAYDTGAAGHAGGAAPAKAAAVSPPPASSPGAAPGAEIVSLSTDAALSTQLLHAARAADGVDPAVVQRVKGAIQNGTYNVPPDKLAQSIIGAMKETT